MEIKTVYFEKPGGENTGETLRIARQRADEAGIKTILVASTGGDTAVKAIEAFKGLRVIAVSHAAGFREPNAQEFTEENRKIFEDKGGTILTTTHTFAGISRAMRKEFNTYVIGEIVASTLRIFGQGMKVVCEIAMMAADGGLVRTDEDAICIAGTGCGADFYGPGSVVAEHVAPAIADARGGCDRGCHTGCGPCGCSFPLLHCFRTLCSQRFCGSGCGEVYLGDWSSDPPDYSDPCDDCGNWLGAGCCVPNWWKNFTYNPLGWFNCCQGCPCGYSDGPATETWSAVDLGAEVTPAEVIPPPAPEPKFKATSSYRVSRTQPSRSRPYYVKRPRGQR